MQLTGQNFVLLENGEQFRFLKGDNFGQRSAHVISSKERRRQRTPTNSSSAHIRSPQPRLARKPVSLASAKTTFNGKRQASFGTSDKKLQHFAKQEGLNVPPRAATVEGTPHRDHPSKPGKEKTWKDGPYGVLWEARDIAQAVNGVVVKSASLGSISTDSRTIKQGEWFLPLVGPNFDGHEFLQQAFDRGCTGVIGRAVSTDWPKGFIRVEEEDTLRALHLLAACVRRRYGGALVGITGSTGKTTARAMTALALESLGTIHQPEGNFNNHIGLPLTLLKLPSYASACVLEMGMNHHGEILTLARIAQPSVRVLLNVGPAHMQHFGSLQDVAAAKGELLSQTNPGDVCVLNADDPLVMSLPVPPGVRVVMFGRQDGCHVRIADAQATRGGGAVRMVLEQFYPASTWVENCSTGSQVLEHLRESSTKSNLKDSLSSADFMSFEAAHGSDLQPRNTPGSASLGLACGQEYLGIGRCASRSGLDLISRVEFEISSPGLHLAVNACAAAAVAVSLGLPLQTVGNSLSKYSPIGMRAMREDIGGGIQLINDAYNSNPMSVESGLKILGSIKCEGRRVALLGDMLELGSLSKKAHLDALDLCQELNLDMVGVVGPSFSEAAACSQWFDKEKSMFMIFRDSQELAAKVVEILRPGDAVLVKGSRGLKMEVAANAIRTFAWEDSFRHI